MLTLAERYAGFRVWYASGEVRTSLDGSWDELPGQDVQYVAFYETRTYQIYYPGPYNATGFPTPGQWLTENYLAAFHSQDYYWLDGTGQPGAGLALDVPDSLPLGAVKTGAWMEQQAFWELVSRAQLLRVWTGSA